jgi:nucleotide-binding universal stress UspA family protein
MTRFATVLVATDGTDDSDGAVDAAIDLAHDTGARLLVLSVVPEGSSEESEGQSGTEGSSRRSSSRDEDGQNDEIAQAAARANGVVDHAIEWGLDAAPIIWEGDPAEAILAAAESENADVIVIGTSSRSGVGRMLMGSISDHVVRNASVPVMVVRAPKD